MDIKYIRLYLDTWIKYRRVIPAHKLCEMIDAIVDVSMGIENFDPQAEAEKQFFAHLKEKLAETQKVYAAKVKASKARWDNDDSDMHDADDDVVHDANDTIMHDAKDKLCMMQTGMQPKPKPKPKYKTKTKNQNQVGITGSSQERESAAVAALTQLENQNKSLNTEIQNLKKFVPPTIDEVAQYCWQKKYWIDPIAFVNFYESKGWFVGKNKMKNWHAAIVTWLGRQSKEQIDKAYKLFLKKYQEAKNDK